MKRLTILATCLLLVGSVSTVALAQQPGHGQQNVQAHTRRGGHSSDAIMRKAAKEVAEAHQILNRALPIYDGHRVNAMQDCREAELQIAEGLKFNRQHDRGAKVEAKPRDDQSAGKYDRKEVERSNAQLVKAADILARTKGQLEKGADEYGGHRVKAIGQIDEAIKQIRLALASVGHKG